MAEEAMNLIVGDCPPLELIAAYLDGRLSDRDRIRVADHLSACEDCYFVFVEAADAHRSAKPDTETPHARWRPYLWPSAAALLTAAAVILAVQIIGPRFQVRRHDSVQVALVAFNEAVGRFRPIEPRVTEYSGYKPLGSVKRSGEATTASLAVRESALAIEKEATAAGAGEEGQRALAAMHLYLGHPARAIDILAPLAQKSTDATLLADLAAAYLVRRETGDPAHALDVADHAVHTSPGQLEAWFNLALAAEALGMSTRAEEAWTRYLQLDRTSDWALEAERHLQELKKPTVR